MLKAFLLNAYRNIPVSHNNFNLSYASDDAVNNVPTSSVKAVVSGGWTSSSNPFDAWNTAYESIFYINTFLEEMGDIEWYWKNETTNASFCQKAQGRSLCSASLELFQFTSGPFRQWDPMESCCGVPIVDHVLGTAKPSDYQIPRSNFKDLVKFIIDDCDSAIAILPDRWTDSGNANVDVAFGVRNTNRINGLTVRLIKAKTLLYAASPAYSDGTYTYQMAAQAAAELMNRNNGLTNVTIANSKHVEFYNDADVPNAGICIPKCFGILPV